MTHTLQNTILHIGLGAFHRAHQAVYLNHLMNAGNTSWSITAGNTRPDMPDIIAALQRQAGEYTLETVTPEGQYAYELIRSIKTVLSWDPQLSQLVHAGANAATKIISFTVTEAGYYLTDDHQLDLSNKAVEHDLEAIRHRQTGSTIYAALTAILRQRMLRVSGPVTLLNCDNLRHNGDRVRTGLFQFIDAIDEPKLLSWIEKNTAFPNSMVDRITPRTPPEVGSRVTAATGRVDEACVMAESFIQWVIEDKFINGRPQWENVGAQLVKSVDAYEEAKIRLLNATHSCIAWAGTLRGHSYIHEGTVDSAIRAMAYNYVTRDAIPALGASPIDLSSYRDSVLERFSNPAICDTNQRVAMDGFSKIPGFILPTISERLAANQSISSVAMLPALFLACLQRWHTGTLPYEYHDQAMNPELAHAICSAADPILAFANDGALWGELTGTEQLVNALRIAAKKVADFETQK
jgi:D-arabinitol 4-dehydrogenase